MKLISKLSIVAFSIFTSVLIGAAEGPGAHHKASFENLEDPDLNRKLVKLKFDIDQQKAGIQEATDMFKKVFPGPVEGSAKLGRVWFADGNSSLVITDSPIPMRIFFKGYFLMDNQQITDKVDKAIKFKISNVEFAEEPILNTLRLPFTDSPYWIYLTFTNYGKGADGDYVDNLKPDSLDY
jgi:hypothetical protein